jgi:endoglucanase
MRHVRVSPLGSLYAERMSSRGVRLMLTAALDEAAFMVSHVDHDGIAWVQPVGRIDPDACAGAAIRFPDGLMATLGVVPVDAGKRAPARLLADFGADSPGSELRIGSTGVFATPWQAERTTIRGKALEGRLGVALALDVARRTARAANSLVLALTALGQVGHRAARSAATDLSPTVAIALGAYPVEEKRPLGASSVSLGKGPVILVRSGGFVADSRMVEALRQAAASARLPCQLAVATDNLAGADAVQSSLDGIITAALLVPCAGVGTPCQQVDTRDLDAAAALLVRLVERPIVL